MPYYDPTTQTVRTALDPYDRDPKPQLVTMYTIRAVYLDGHEAHPVRRFRTRLEAEEYKERYINQYLTGYYVRHRWVESFLVMCDVVPVKVRTLLMPR